MNLKIRTKILFGILFLFIEFLVIGFLGIYYISSINSNTGLMIKDNYRSVQYSENMIQAIDDIQTAVSSKYLNKMYSFDKNSLTLSFDKFEENLKSEENNITELGEKELAQTIHQMYFKYKSFVLITKTDSVNDKIGFFSANISPIFSGLKTKIFAVSTLNMQAIVQKNENLNETVNSAYKNLTIALTLCFLITFAFTFNFPNYIAKPIQEITDSIKEIANRNYKTQIEFSANNELKQLAEAFDYMSEKLEENRQIIAENQSVKETKSIDQNQVLQNIELMLGSVRTLKDSLLKEKKQM
jgi:nitrogen fixation/metabolism regulation signal transduction histidine kinase